MSKDKYPSYFWTKWRLLYLSSFKSFSQGTFGSWRIFPLGTCKNICHSAKHLFFTLLTCPQGKTRAFTWVFRYCLFIHLSFYEKGSEAIDWFIANGFATTRHEGIQIGQVCKLHCNIKLKNSYYSQTGEIDITDW